MSKCMQTKHSLTKMAKCHILRASLALFAIFLFLMGCGKILFASNAAFPSAPTALCKVSSPNIGLALPILIYAIVKH